MTTIIIPVHNRLDYLKRCLQSVYEADLSVISNITIVDDGSCEEVAEYVRKIGAPEGTGVTLTKERNDFALGIKRSMLNVMADLKDKYSTFIILDSDAIVSPDAFTSLLDLKAQYPQHIVSGFISGTNEEANPTLWEKENHIARKLCMGINVVFGAEQWEPIVKKAFEADGDWDMNIAKFTNKETIITQPSVIQHIGYRSTFGRGDATHLAKDFKHNPYKITIIHPSRNRPVHAYKTIDMWLGNAKNPDNIEYIMVVDDDDALLRLYPEALTGKYEGKVKVLVQNKKRKWYQKKPTLNAITAINSAASIALGNLMVVVSDDFVCPKQWDEQLLFYTEGMKDMVVKTIDGSGNDWLCTLPIVDKTWYKRFGYIYNPNYRHLFSDCELSSVAEMLGKLIKLPILFEHKHPMFGHGQEDQVNVKNNKTWEQGEKVYLERLAKNFELTGEFKPLKANKSHREWLKTKGITL